MEKQSWFERYINRDVINSAAQAAGGLMVAASSLLGVPAVLATSALSAGASALITREDIKYKEGQYLNLYKNELGLMFDKDPKDLTRADLELAAKPVSEGGKGMVALQKQMGFLRYRERFTNIANVATTAVLAAAMIAIVVFAPPLLTQFNLLLTTMVGGASITFLQKASRSAADAYVRDYGYKFSINKHLMDITTELEQKPVQPTRIMGLFVAANPELNDHIKAAYGDDYERLVFSKKEQVVSELEPQLHVRGLTQEINNGNIRPSIIGFLAYGQGLEGSADYEKYKLLANAPAPALSADAPEQASLGARKDYTTRIAEQRSLPADHSKIH